MNRIVVKSRVGSDGILQLVLPVGSANADREVQVSVEPIAPAALSPDEWRRRILETAGTWDGPLERPEQGEYEQREYPRRTGDTALTDDELLLFDFMFDGPVTFCAMRVEDYAFHMNTRYSHRLDDRELASTIQSLRDRSLVVRTTEPIWSIERHEFVHGHRYTLSEQGGALWEAERRPLWNRYVTDAEFSDAGRAYGSVRITCADAAIARLCAGAMFAAGMLVPQSQLRVRTLSGVRLLPWKTFDTLAVLRFRTINNWGGADGPVGWGVYAAARCWWRTVAELDVLSKDRKP